MDMAQVTEVSKKNAVSIAAGVVALVAIAAIFFYVNPQLEGLQDKLAQSKATAEKAESLATKSRPTINISTSGSARDETLRGFPTAATIRSGEQVIDAVNRQADSLLEEAVDANRKVPLLFEVGQRFETMEEAYAAAAEVWPLEGERKLTDRTRWLNRYKEYLNIAGRFDDATGSYPANTIQGALRATRPPTSQSLANAQERLRAQIEANEPKNDQGEFLNPAEVEAKVEAELMRFARGVKFNRASDHLIYVDQNTFSVHPVADKTERPNATECFEAQVQLWVQEEVAGNLYRANVRAVEDLPTDQQNVVYAPVKQIVSIEVPERFVPTTPLAAPEGGDSPAAPGDGGGGMDPYGDPYGGIGDPYGGSMDPYGFGGGEFGAPSGGGGGGGAAAPGNRNRGSGGGAAAPRGGNRGSAAGGAPAPRVAVGGGRRPAGPDSEETGPSTPVTYDPAAEIEREYQYSPTGRPLHTPFYDITQFNVRLRVEAEQLPYVLQQLQSESFITVLNVPELVAVDPLVMLQQGYVFGDQPVIEVDLQCEILFLRAWTVDFMPETIRQELQIWE